MPQVPPPVIRKRAQKKAAASGTGAVATGTPRRTGKKSNAKVNDPNTGQQVGEVQVHRAHSTLKNDPPPLYRPMLLPGVKDKPGHSMSRCTITPYQKTTAAGDPNPYVFVFHYNPDQVGISASVNPGVKLTSEVDTTTRNILQVGGSVVLSGLIDRQQEMWADSKSAHPGPGNSRSFRDFGTLYDLEWMYRVFNGDPKAKANRQIKSLVPNQSNYGYLFPTTAVVWLNPTSRFLAFPVSFSMNHQKYTPSMVPMVTTFDLTMVLAAKGRGSRKDVVDNSGATVPDWASNMSVDNFNRLTSNQ